MKNELVSVVIPAYNREALVTQALDSVYQQSYRPLELIVVDDGSTDGTAQAVRAWMEAHTDSDGFVTRLVCQSNRGGNVARNRGIEASAGAFVAFLDSDDLWAGEKLQKQMALFDNPEVGGVYCGVQHVDLSLGKTTPSSKRNYPVGWILDQILVRDVTAPTSTFVLRKEIFKKAGAFDPALQARQDWDMWIRLAAAHKVGAVPEALVQYREHVGPRTASDPMREIRAFETIRTKYATLLQRQPLRVQKAARASYYKRKGRVYYHHKISTVKALHFYALALWNQPADFDAWAAMLGIFLPTGLRQGLHYRWNSIFGGTNLSIRSH
jgi:glycosyltransferase involved in cell wall biosynthesis